MKICVLAYTGLDTDGRDATRILKEMESLVKAGHEVNAVGLKLRKDIPERENYCGAEITRIRPFFEFDRKIQGNAPRIPLLGSVIQLYRLTIKNTFFTGIPLLRAALRRNADVYHLFGMYAFVPGLYLKVFKRKKTVYDAYEVPHNISRMPSLGLFAKPLSRLVGEMELFAASRMDYVLTLPSAGDEYYKRFKKRNKNVVVIRNVPPVSWNSANFEEFNQKEYSGKKVLFYMGAFTRAKGIIKLLEVLRLVMNAYPDVKLLLVGSFDAVQAYDNAKEEAMRYIKDHHLSEYVTITGHVPWQEIPRYLGIADIALHLYQPLPVLTVTQGSSSFFEYMAAGIPIVGSNSPGFGTIIDNYKCGIAVNPTDVEEAAGAVLKLLNNNQLAKELSNNGRKAFEQEFNWQVQEEKLVQVYNQLGGRGTK